MQPNCSQDNISTILNSFSEIWDNLSEEEKNKYIITIHTDNPEEFDFEKFKIQLNKIQGK